MDLDLARVDSDLSTKSKPTTNQPDLTWLGFNTEVAGWASLPRCHGAPVAEGAEVSRSALGAPPQ